jgi:integrase
MAKLTDIQIKAWVRSGERFDGRSDGNGLYLCFPKNYAIPFWRFRYRFVGKQRAMVIGTYSELSLAKARETAKELSARVALGYDVAGEKQERKAEALKKIEEEKNALKVAELAQEYFERQILGNWKHPDILRRRIEKDINPNIGHLKIEDVRPAILMICCRKSSHETPLQWLMMSSAGPAASSTMVSNAICWRVTPQQRLRSLMLEVKKSRERWLTREELIKFFQAMRITQGFSRQNELTMKLLLALCCRKMELCAAQWVEFDLDNAIWHLPAERVKNGDAIDIPLPAITVEWLKELRQMSLNSQWVLPARKMQHRMIPHIQESTLPVALAKVRSNLPEVPNFTIHDFRRTGRSHLAALRC